MASVTFENATRRFGKKGKQNTAVDNLNSVSYTHLTLPTIYSV